MVIWNLFNFLGSCLDADMMDGLSPDIDLSESLSLEEIFRSAEQLIKRFISKCTNKNKLNDLINRYESSL